MKEIRFKINDEGEISLEVIGAQGAECDDLTAPFEESLGVIAKKTRKEAYFENEERQYGQSEND